MKKITELTEKRKRTEYVKDALGNRERRTVEYIAKRPVKTVKQGPRFGHFFVDWILFEIIIYLVDYIFDILIAITNASETTQLTIHLFQGITTLLLFPALYAFCEFVWQRTPGKWLTKTVVIDEYGNKPSGGAIVLRSICRFVPFEPFSCLGDYSHGWHDRWSKTWVVTLEELEQLKKIQAEQSA